MDKQEDIICFTFEPWLYSNTEQLMSMFFKDLSDCVGNKYNQNKLSKIFNSYAEAFEVISHIPEPTGFYAGLIISLAKDLHPDLQDFTTEELVKTLPIDYHVGLVYKSGEKERLNELLENAAKIIVEKHLSIMPPKDKPTT